MDAPNIQHDRVTDIFSNVWDVWYQVMFHYKPKGWIDDSHRRKGIQHAYHDLWCKELNVGFHSVKELGDYAQAILKGEIVEEVDELEELKNPSRFWAGDEFLKPTDKLDLSQLAWGLWVDEAGERRFKKWLPKMEKYIERWKMNFRFKKFQQIYGVFLNFDTFVFFVWEQIIRKMNYGEQRDLLIWEIQNFEPWLQKIYAVKEALIFYQG